jgi:hypothetical protein
MLKKLILLLTVTVIFSALTVFGQKKEQNEEDPSPQRETRVERPVETPREEPKRVETPREEPKQVETPRAEPKRSDNSSNNNNNESRQRPNRKEREPDSDEPRPTRRPKDNDNDDENLNRPKRPEKPPVENPNPSDNPNPQPVENNNNTQGGNNNRDKDRDRDRDRNRDDKDKDDKKRNRNRGGIWGGYPYPTNYPTTTSSPSKPFSIRDYFDKDDVFFDIDNVYVDVPENYLPFFDDSPSIAFKPLYYSYGRRFFRNEFPFVADNWTIYYEPDLDDIYVDFLKLGQVKYERMVMYPIGETIKKASKKFDYKGNDVRPVLVEKIPDIEQDKIYSFNVHDLPKGDYELRFIARDGSTVKHLIRLK